MTIAQTLADSPLDALGYGADPDGRKMRAKVAQALLLQGSSTEPVKHWTQGLARVAQALTGGYMGGQIARESGQENAAISAALDPLLGSATAPRPQTSVETAPAPSGPTPASIRTNNPGAQYPGPVATSYGSPGFDTIGGGHKIARFNSPEEGAAAQFSLLAKNYSGMPLSAAINKWSGGNSAPQYVSFITQKTGLQPNTVITPELLQSPQGVALVKTMAQHEAGRPFPMTDEQWTGAQGLAFAPSRGVQPPVQSGQPAGQPQQFAQATRSQADIPPQVVESIKRLRAIGSKEANTEALKLVNQWAKPVDVEYSYHHNPDGSVVATNKRDPRDVRVMDPGQADRLIKFAADKQAAEKAATITAETAVKNLLPGTSEEAMRLRKEFRDESSYKNLAQTVPVYKSMVEAAGRDNRAADVNLIYGMAKLMDPGSVVRESEMTVAQAVATLPQSLQAQIKSQLTATGRLSPDVREAIMVEAQSRVGAYRSMFDQDAQQYSGIAERSRIRREDVIPSFPEVGEYKAPAKAPTITPEQAAAELARRRSAK